MESVNAQGAKALPKKNGPVKTMFLNVLNGLAIGVVVALVPGALLGQLMLALEGVFAPASYIVMITTFVMTLLPVLSGVCVGMLSHFTPIQTAGLAMAAMAGAGNMQVTKAGFVVKGTGDVINIFITLCLGYILVLVFGERLKAYTILLVPALILIIAGGLGHLLLTPVGYITKATGMGVAQLTTLQPVLMGAVMGIVFALLILSPISSVGIATAITLQGVGSGSANLGITAAGFALAIYGWRSNTIGTALAHFLGSPKIQMANLLAKPKLYLPICINAAILGAAGALIGIKGTPMSAGFGFAGLMGPMAAWQTSTNHSAGYILMLVLMFFVAPVALGLISNYIFKKNFFKSTDFELDYK